MTILIAALASTTQPPNFVLFIAFLIGALLFIFGFRTYREYRVLAETPETPVRSIPLGLVRGRGRHDWSRCPGTSQGADAIVTTTVAAAGQGVPIHDR